MYELYLHSAVVGPGQQSGVGRRGGEQRETSHLLLVTLQDFALPRLPPPHLQEEKETLKNTSNNGAINLNTFPPLTDSEILTFLGKLPTIHRILTGDTSVYQLLPDENVCAVQFLTALVVTFAFISPRPLPLMMYDIHLPL